MKDRKCLWPQLLMEDCELVDWCYDPNLDSWRRLGQGKEETCQEPNWLYFGQNFKKRLCMYLLIIIVPLLCSCVAIAFGCFLSSWGTLIVTSTCISLYSILSWIVSYEVT